MRLLLTLGLLLPAWAAMAPPPQSLLLHQPVLAGLAGGPAVAFAITAAPGEFLHVETMQLGIDVEVRLYDPTGKQVAYRDSLNGSWGPEPISIIAPAAGAYRLVIKSSSPGVAFGHVRVELTQLAPPTARDRARLAAESLYMRGINLYIAGDAKSLQAAVVAMASSAGAWHAFGDPDAEALSWASRAFLNGLLGNYTVALPDYTLSLSLYRAAHDRYGEAQSLGNLATANNSLGHRDLALTQYQQALALDGRLGDRVDEGLMLNSQGIVADEMARRPEALALYQQALVVLRTTGEGQYIADALSNLGILQDDMGDTAAAIAAYNQALAINRSLGDRQGIANRLNNLGLAYVHLGQPDRALDYYHQALQLAQSLGNQDQAATCYSNMGGVDDDTGDRQAALAAYHQALALFRAAGDRQGEADTLTNIGDVQAHTGDAPAALATYAQALALQKSVGARNRVAGDLNAMGLVYEDTGENQKALDAFQRALALHQAVGDRKGIAATTANFGQVYGELGEYQRALDYYHQALALQRHEDDPRDSAITLNNIGYIYSDMHQPQPALAAYAEALPLERQVHDRADEAATLNNMGEAYEKLNELSKAQDLFHQALDLDRQVGNRSGEARSLANLGLIADKRNQFAAALADFQQGLALARDTSDVPEQATILACLMKRWMTTQPELAVLFGKEAINTLQRLRRNIAGLPMAEQKSYLTANAANYRALAGLLVSQGRLPEAQQVLDFLKLDENAEYVHTRGADPSATAPVGYTSAEETAVAAYEKQTADVVAVDQEWSALDRKPDRTAAEDTRYQQLGAQLTAANAALDTYFTQLYAHFGQGAMGNRGVAAIQGETSALQEDLDLATIALYTVVLDDRTVIMVITPDTRAARTIAVSRMALQTKIFAFDGLLRQPNAPLAEVQKQGFGLYQLLFAPVAGDIAAAHAQTLVWSLDGVLRYLPLAALYDGHQYLVERYRNAIITTAGVGDLRDAPQVTAASTGLAMGVSNSYLGMPALPSVPSELDAVVHTASVADSHGPIPGSILLNGAFTESGMEAALHRRPAIVHIASHYAFQVGDDTSYLLLGGDSGSKLTLHDFANNPAMRMDGVELLTLSACQSALGSNTSDRGRQDDGREIDGLGLEAQRKHAKAVMATLWDVNDRSTGQLMAAFYGAWLKVPGASKSEALRQAQLSLLHGAYPSPYYWAPFILIGNWK